MDESEIDETLAITQAPEPEPTKISETELDQIFPGFKDKFDRNRLRFVASGGMTKREIFAGLALQSLLMIPNEENLSPDGLAFQAVQYADALIRQLKRQTANNLPPLR